MEKGISPIVAVVLLIAIAVIAAVGLYFWVGGLATQQPTPTRPIVISATRVNCSTQPGTANVTALVTNLDISTSVDQNLGLIGDNGTCWNSSNVNIAAGSQGVVIFGCDVVNVSTTTGQTYIIYSDSITKSISQARMVC